jgi:hypothetical protein
MAVGNLPLDIRTRDIEVCVCVCMCVHRAGYCEHSYIFNIYQNNYAYLMAMSGDGQDLFFKYGRIRDIDLKTPARSTSVLLPSALHSVP